jgi:hypothetical protein
MNKDLINSFIAILLILAIGLVAGYSLGFYRATQNRFPEIRQIADINPARPLKTADLNIPADAEFVASSKGKIYYSVFDTKAWNISEKNRIFFKNATEAEKAGYQKTSNQP